MYKYQHVPKLLKPSGAHNLIRSEGVGSFAENEDGFYATFSGKANDTFYILGNNANSEVFAQSTSAATIEPSLCPAPMLYKEDTKSLILYSDVINVTSTIVPLGVMFTLAKITLTTKGTVYLYSKK